MLENVNGVRCDIFDDFSTLQSFLSIFGLVFVNPSFAISIFVSPLMNKNSSSFAVGSLMSGFLSSGTTNSISVKNLSTVCVSAPQKLLLVSSSRSFSYIDFLLVGEICLLDYDFSGKDPCELAYLW